MNVKRICSVLVVAVMLMGLLCGCPANDPIDTTPTGTTGTSEPPVVPTTTAPPVTDTKVTYTVTVVDADGNPVAGVVIQLCDDSNCKMPIVTDESGKASASYDPAEYHVTVTQLPDGYALEEADAEFYFADGATELQIVVVPTAGE